MMIAPISAKHMNTVRCLSLSSFFASFVGSLLLGICVNSFGPCVAAGERIEEEGLISNPDFREGDTLPASWTRSSGSGRWVDRNILEVEGQGRGTSYWFTNVRLQPGTVYRFWMIARGINAHGGCVISGPATVNHDYTLSEAWHEYSHVFRMPDGPGKETLLRLGQWELSGRVQFDQVELVRVLPIHACWGDCVFGDGESIQDGVYVFEGTFARTGTNHHRVLYRATAAFNTNRWVFSEDREVVYRFQLPQTQFHTGELGFSVNYATGGSLLAEVSHDGESWREVARQEGVGSQDVELPADLFPAGTVFIRLRRIGPPSSIQVDRIEFRGKIDRILPDFRGTTIYAVWHPQANDVSEPPVDVFIEHRGGAMPANLKLRTKNLSGIRLNGEVLDQGQGSQALMLVSTIDRAEKEGEWSVTLPQLSPGQHRCLITIFTADRCLGVLEIPWEVNQYYRTDYGQLLQDRAEAVLWWCEADWKIPRDRPPPVASAKGDATIHLSAARGDYESAQLVISPRKDCHLKSVKVSPLTHNSGTTLGDSDIQVSYVYYHYVHTPTDKTGVRDWWPDALPPLDGPIPLMAGKNQPLWITVHVSRDKPAGDYFGQITVVSDAWEATIPILLHVWNFTLPERNHIETAFGFNLSLACRYHNVSKEEDRRRLLDLYFESFSEHRISPYNPTPLDPFVVQFEPQANPPVAKIDFSRFDRAMEKALQRFHFTNFDLPIHGMGGGTFHDRIEPSLAGFGESTPQYQAMFADQVRQIEAHLREKGWLEMAYVYWFDEPEPKDYDFVRAGMERLKKYAPGLRRMLTEEPVEPLYGAVDIWCPVTPNYNHEIAESRRQHGERFWWYVCTGPKAPYCTLFIDHPAIELRVWLWQTWQRKIDGILVWSSNYWTSSAAFPDGFQDPYEDPMGYVSGYSTPKGVKRHWGNGDGRFIYPPLAASVPGKTTEPVIAKPVSSIRWEMLREGIEDFEMLWLLRELLSQKGSRLSAESRQEIGALLTVPPEITSDMTTFTKSPRPIYEHRSKVAQAIETLIELE